MPVQVALVIWTASVAGQVELSAFELTGFLLSVGITTGGIGITNYFLFRLQRHADHHVHPLRPYQTLRHFEESPQLPTGYAGMVVLLLIPPLWRRVMDVRVKANNSIEGGNSPVGYGKI